MNAGPMRWERRLDTPRWLGYGLPFIATVIALVVAAVVLLVSRHDPISTYRQMVDAGFSGSRELSNTLASATPLLLTGLAASFAFRMRVWNIGAEGQMYFGAIAAGAAGIALGGSGLAVALPAMIAAGALGGLLWAAIPGLLRAYLHTNEILTTLMFNYVASLFMYYLIFDSGSYWRDLTSPNAKLFPQGKFVGHDAFWPGFTQGSTVLPLGFVLGLVIAVILFVVIRHTRAGFQVRVIADSPDVGHYAGIRTKRVVLLVMLVSGGLAGLAGASQIGDFGHQLDPVGLPPNAYGYTGIVVAALARLNPLVVPLTALLLGALTNAGYALQGPDFPQGLVGTLEGIILFCVLGGEVLGRYRITLRRSSRTPAKAETSPAHPAQDLREPVKGGAG